MSDTHQMIRFDNSVDLGKWYDQKYTEMGDGWECPREAALSYLEFMGIVDKQDNKTLLDVGCGAGHFIQTAQEFVDCLGIDLSYVAIHKAQERCPQSTFAIGNIEIHELGSERFDYITSVGSIEHCIDINAALWMIQRKLKDDGVFYALVPNEAWQHFDQPQETTHTDEEWETIFKHGGFKTVKFRRNGDISEFLLRRAQ